MNETKKAMMALDLLKWKDTVMEENAKDCKKAVATIKEHLSSIVALNSPKATVNGLEIIQKLLGNITNDPKNERYRTLRKTIPKI